MGTVTHLDSDKCNPLLHAIWDGCDLLLLPFWVTEHADSPLCHCTGSNVTRPLTP